MRPRYTLLFISAMLIFITQLSGQEVLLLYNHIGYETEAVKPLVVRTQPGAKLEQIQVWTYPEGKLVLEPTFEFVGGVDQWRDWQFWKSNMDVLQREGVYQIKYKVDGVVRQSFPFKIQNDLLERNTLSDVVYYFKGQRSSGLLDKADAAMTFSEGRTDTIDVHGGWYDATGDYGKHISHLTFSTYFNPQQINLTVWSLFATYEALEAKSNPSFRQYQRRLLDEAMFGADFLVRMKVPGGSFYRTISGKGPKKLPEDRRITPTMTGFSITKDPQDGIDGKDEIASPELSYEISFRAGAGLSIAALAIASGYEVSGDFSNAEYLKVAEEAFEYVQANNLSLTNDGKENIVDDYCALMAATELYKATQKESYKKAASERAGSLTKRMITNNDGHTYFRADSEDRPFFHAADAGLPIVSLINYMAIANADEQADLKKVVKEILQSEIALSAKVNNPFGYPRQLVQSKDGSRRYSFFYPHDAETSPWWQGENARLGSIATASRMAIGIFEDEPEFQKALSAHAWNQLNWILGLNPFDACMLEGHGRNNVQYLFFNSYEYTNAPGGICNGITGGLYNENDIDLNRGYNETGKDNDWRWAEQWLPHAAWYLIAISSR